ncbi:UDP-N-acetylmuramoyl-L-alanine--D-glutamate ligase [Odoribacter sp. OttesenSCG-928-L07]|nr:UDP-N-acetylmuramoyl-L-alanine--D-glutamate ligase [Odoribacter sp. OttesenSCG-928-L07]MDL2240455.1 UDP-N-acetylmuramoyl-L-alanine--D-glutamate ligase [Bacteroidales bacterium OttesenSCG-928-K22]
MQKLISKLFDGKQILILGFGKEGKSTYEYLTRFIDNERLSIADANENAISEEIKLKHKTFCGENYNENLKNFDLIIKSPGIPEKHIENISVEKITSQTDLFLRKYYTQTIGITGTKGKSTTSSLIHHILKQDGHNSILAGNIGIPIFSQLDKIDDNTIIVLELSAHQLNHINIAPKISILLNIYEEHLDHFGNFENYINAKCKIFEKQKNNSILITDRNIEKIDYRLEDYKGDIIFLNDESIEIQGDLQGEHNKKNIAAVKEVAQIFNIEEDKIDNSIISFKSLDHRLEFVGNFFGIKFYNDSISTIPEAAIAAFETIKDVDTVILGGYDRGINYNKLCRFIANSDIRNIILMGEAGKRIEKILKEKWDTEAIFVDNLEKAVEVAFKETEVGKSCVLSPAASSYDAFKNFEERGNFFKDYIRKYKG